MLVVDAQKVPASVVVCRCGLVSLAGNRLPASVVVCRCVGGQRIALMPSAAIYRSCRLPLRCSRRRCAASKIAAILRAEIGPGAFLIAECGAAELHR